MRTKIEIDLLARVDTLELDQRGVLILVSLAALEAKEDTLAVQAAENSKPMRMGPSEQKQRRKAVAMCARRPAANSQITTHRMACLAGCLLLCLLATLGYEHHERPVTITDR